MRKAHELNKGIKCVRCSKIAYKGDYKRISIKKLLRLVELVKLRQLMVLTYVMNVIINICYSLLNFYIQINIINEVLFNYINE